MRIVFSRDRFAAKVRYPVGQSKLDFIAQTRRFMMLRDPRTQHGTVKIDTNQQLYRAGVAVRRGGFEDGSNRSLVPRAI